MTKHSLRNLFLLFAAATIPSIQVAAATSAGLSPQAPPTPHTAPVIVELFTSQGCSSCPPADVVLQKLGRESGIITLSMPVTYWDNLGWKDTLAHEANTKKQHDYAQRLEDDGVYTPQAVVDGVRGTVGSREGELRSLIANQRAAGGKVSVQAEHAPGGGLKVTIGAGAPHAAVHVFALRSSVTVPVGGGENSSRKLTYTNVVINDTVVGKTTGGAQSITVPASALAGNNVDRVAIVVQEVAVGPIRGGTLLSLK